MKTCKTEFEKIEDLARSNGGIFTSSLAEQNGIHRAMLSYFLKMGRLERPARGVYALPDAWEDEMWLLQNQYKRGIYSGITALYLHGLTDQTPLYYEMTFPATYNLSKVKKDNRIKVQQHQVAIYDDGIVTAETTFGNRVKVYRAEQVLCTILRKQYHTDIQIVANAFKLYTRRANPDIASLTHYSKLFHVENQLRSYLEVLL